MQGRVREGTAESRAADRRLRTDVVNRRRAEEILQAIAEGTSGDVGPDFFRSVVRVLAQTLDVRYAFVAEALDSPTTRVRTLAAWMGDSLGENVEYDVADTPCEQTVRGVRTFYARDVQRLFPNDHVLIELGAVSYCGLPIAGAGGDVIGHVAVLDDKAMDDDFSELPALQILVARAAGEMHRRRAEEQARHLHDELAHVSRRSTMGEMASYLAHELNQPLSAITLNANACRRSIEGGEFDRDDARQALQEIATEALRAGEVIRRLRRFVTHRGTQRSLVDLNHVVREVAPLLEPEARKRGVHLRFHLGETTPPIHVDVIQIQQVVVNLVRNAFEAVSESPSPCRRVVITTARTSEEARLDVSDTGVGISSENLKRVFQPYFSTKPEGLGMGLSISQSIIAEHGGRLWATPNPDAGVTLHVVLPAQGNGGQALENRRLSPGDR